MVSIRFYSATPIRIGAQVQGRFQGSAGSWGTTHAVGLGNLATYHDIYASAQIRDVGLERLSTNERARYDVNL